MAKKVFLIMVLFCLNLGILSAQEQQQEPQEQELQEQQEQQEPQEQEQQEQELQEQELQEQEFQEQELQEQELQEQEQQEQEFQEQEQQEQEFQEQELQEQQEQQPQQQQQAQQHEPREHEKIALTFSAGAGLFIGGDIGSGVSTEKGLNGPLIKIPYMGGGGSLFFDATYAEISFGIFGGGGSRVSLVNLYLGLLGKYPFVINDKISVFPLLGIDYQITVSTKFKDGTDIKYSDLSLKIGNLKIADDLSALWIKFGGGLDYRITEKIYARAEVLYGLKIVSKFETTMKTIYEDDGVSAETYLGHAPTVRLAVGYKF